MKRFTPSMALGLAVLAVAGFTRSAKAGDEQPFSAEALVQVIDSYKNGFLTGGTGEATHLGQISVMGAVRVFGDRSTSSIVLTGANEEDSITMESESFFDPDLGHFIGIYEIDGGTGRFEGATGYGVIEPIPLGGGQFEVHYDGVISR